MDRPDTSVLSQWYFGLDIIDIIGNSWQHSASRHTPVDWTRACLCGDEGRLKGTVREMRGGSF